MSDFNTFGQYGDGGFEQGETSFNQDQASSQKQALRTSLTPVTIKQINLSTQPIPDGEFQINGVNLNMVSFVGIIRNVVDNNSAVVLTIEDGTGSLEVRKWIDENSTSASEESAKYEALKFKYVLVTGALKEFNQKKNIQNATVSPITDHNEVTYHFLSAINVHVKSQGIGLQPKNDLFVQESAPANGNDNIEDKICSLIAQLAQNLQEGVPLKYVAQHLNLDEQAAKAICEGLCQSGKLYQAYDENSFLAL